MSLVQVGDEVAEDRPCVDRCLIQRQGGELPPHVCCTFPRNVDDTCHFSHLLGVLVAPSQNISFLVEQLLVLQEVW